jgi:hypothetical protein
MKLYSPKCESQMHICLARPTALVHDAFPRLPIGYSVGSQLPRRDSWYMSFSESRSRERTATHVLLKSREHTAIHVLLKPREHTAIHVLLKP